MTTLQNQMIQANTAGTGNSPCTKQGVSVINGVPTEILYINYGNRDFVLITQVGKMGTVLDIKKYVDGFGEMKQIVNTVFGKRGDENLELYARMVARMISPKTPKPVTVSLALKDASLEHREDMKRLIESICR